MNRQAILIPTRREVSADITSKNAELLIRAGYIRPLMAGVTMLLPLGERVIQKISQIVRQEMNAVGGQEVRLTALQPRELWDKSDRWDVLGADVMYQFKDRSGRDVGLGMTHEEPMVQLVKDSFGTLSYQDLPLALYQIQAKFRDEARAKAGLLRGREFLMKDLYSFHTGQADLDAYYETVKDAYVRIYQRLSLPSIITEASGGVFSTEHSHEFQTPTMSGEDTIYFCPTCELAWNDEIKTDLPRSGDHYQCPNCQSELVIKRSIEVGNIFKIGTKYTDALDLTYRAQDGSNQPIPMGCYGLGITRAMGALVEVSHDDRGIIWPASVAPFDAHLIVLGDAPEQKQAKTLVKKLEQAGLDVLVDDRPISAGEKLTEADLLGLPYRLVISPKTAGQVEFKSRTDQQVTLFDEEALQQRLTTPE